VCVSAHTPLLYIEDNEDGTIYIEGGFSDGSSAAGIAVRIEDANGNTLWEGVLGDFGSVESAPIPDVRPYYVMFDAGPGHVVTKEGIYPPAALDPEDVAPSNDGQDIHVPPSESATSSTSAPVVTPAITPIAESATPSVAAPPAWMPGTTTTSAQGSGSANSILWIIVALLSFIALMLLILCGGALFLIGWMVGKGRQPQ
ncbi:hypothetical protein KAW64_00985, partial [bacterium]|nr:hypothetical protein [bacterium]